MLGMDCHYNDGKCERCRVNPVEKNSLFKIFTFQYTHNICNECKFMYSVYEKEDALERKIKHLEELEKCKRKLKELE